DKDTGKQGAEDEDTQDDDTGKQGTEDPDEVKTQLDKVTTLVEEAEAELEKGNIENAISKLDEAENAAEELKRLAEESGNPADLLAAAEAFSKLAIARAKVTEALVKEGKLDDADAQFKKAEEAAKTSRELATKVDTAVKATADTADDELGTKADGHAKAAEAAVAKAKKALDDAKAAKAEADAKAKEAEKQAADLAEAKQKATAVIEKLPYLSDDERKDFLEQVKNADSSSSVVTILANAMKASVTNNPNLSKEDKEKYTNAFDSGMTIDELINQNPYTDSGELKDAANQDPSTGETTSGSSKIPWWAYLLGFLGIGGGVLGWGYVHDADFRAVVDEAIANVERALGLRH
ncbi:MAG: GA module-containing protein, partial [Corynebacterium sp.]|nr:GA module-containing protein [Corynebacterium sp.]